MIDKYDRCCENCKWYKLGYGKFLPYPCRDCDVMEFTGWRPV